MEKIIENIIDTEKKADEIVLNAKEASIKTVGDAESKAEKTKAECLENNKRVFKQKCFDEEQKANKEYFDKLKEFEKQAEQIKENSEDKFEKAVKILVDAIV